ncbi:hypothetical protein DdX_21279 [Ditylenchus destructor]|uniref:Secreted protein n=1 Tax=Ditylenchus destructor TaxID=166010 RepID=A0AAD4QT53_9BILA|nr:hypothetical protein DdX_21279 [Ditylenchus destructor]
MATIMFLVLIVLALGQCNGAGIASDLWQTRAIPEMKNKCIFDVTGKNSGCASSASTTVRNCWLHTKIVVDENEPEIGPVSPEAIEELGNLLEQYCVVTEVEVLTAPEYAALDKQVATGEILTDEDVLQLVARGNQAENDDSDDSDIEAIGPDPPKISVADAIRGLETALSFMEQEQAENGDDLVATKRTIMRLTPTKLPTKQTLSQNISAQI